MVITFLFILLISILLFFSLKFLKGRFDSFEIFIYFLFTSYLCQIFFYLLSSPYQRLRVVEEHLPFWTTRLLYGMAFPILLMWVMYYMRGNMRFSVKITLCFSWVVFGVFIEKILLVIGVLESNSKSWYPSIDLVLGMVVLSVSIYFLEILPPVLRREKVIQDEADI